MVTNTREDWYTKALMLTFTRNNEERQETALTAPLNDPPPQVPVSPFLSLPPSEEVVPLSGRSTETSQSEGRCHNKQKQHSNPPKSNQEPLIHALNGDWVPWEWLIQYGHRQHDRGLQQFSCVLPYHSVLTFRLDSINSKMIQSSLHSNIWVEFLIFFYFTNSSMCLN